jgi:hypothetical protein
LVLGRTVSKAKSTTVAAGFDSPKLHLRHFGASFRWYPQPNIMRTVMVRKLELAFILTLVVLLVVIVFRFQKLEREKEAIKTGYENVLTEKESLIQERDSLIRIVGSLEVWQNRAIENDAEKLALSRPKH